MGGIPEGPGLIQRLKPSGEGSLIQEAEIRHRRKGLRKPLVPWMPDCSSEMPKRFWRLPGATEGHPDGGIWVSDIYVPKGLQNS